MHKRTKTILAIILFILILFLCYVGYMHLSKNYGQSQTTKTESGTTEKETEKTKVPDFTVYDQNGKVVHLSDYKGKPVVINFWASWCPPCKSELPHFEEIYQSEKDKVVFLMVDLTDGERETQDKAQSYMQSMHYTFPVYFDLDENAAMTYGIRSIPMTLFIDKDGYVSEGHTGAITLDTLKAGIEAIAK